jgi:hypothetical protein
MKFLEELLREVRRLRNVFRVAGLDARAFRRRLRAKSGGNRFSLSESGRLRRSKKAKQVFADAEHFAALADCTVHPAHLLHAVLLADDEGRDAVMDEPAINKSIFTKPPNAKYYLSDNQTRQATKPGPI